MSFAVDFAAGLAAGFAVTLGDGFADDVALGVEGVERCKLGG